ncbi:MAG TPA: ORF6N domain-containing protein [Bacteriovoracaceae bacterium]|nr:ORF6N domain-containing protein [Bacteriovoracaceae bacterium]
MSDIILSKIENMIYSVRGHKVMLDSDLAQLYNVETKVLNQAIKRHLSRFPSDFMFQLSTEEYVSLRSQIVTSKESRGGRRYLPLVFTEAGVAMLSSVLTSERAAQVNVSIMRTFIRLRSFLSMESSLESKVSKLQEGTNKLFKVVFERLDAVEEATPALRPNRKKIGLKLKN